MSRLSSISIPIHLLLLGLLLGTSGCQRIQERFFGAPIEEGVIHYDVSFPYSEDDGLMSSMLPNKMTMKFEKDRYVTELNAGMGMFRMRFIADNENKTLEHTLKVLKEKSVVKMEEDEALKMIDRFPDLSIFPSLGRDTIGGLSCKRATGVFEAMEEPSMRIHYTEQIALKNPNWCNQFHELDGVLMGYEVKRFGKRMRLKAKKVESKEIPDKAFSTEDHKTISPEEMNEKMKKLMKSFE